MEVRDLSRIVYATASRYAMFTPGQTVVVGVSGGPDSVALLHALTELRSHWNLRLVAAHLNHGFRGAEADADSDYVAALAETLALPCFIGKADVPALKKRRHLSAQEAAREARHAFLRQIAAQENAERIALGHTQDDRIETVLLNLLRGTGPDGLQGFPPVALPLVRPLYAVRRSETEAYCTAHTLQPRCDSSNAKTDYRRNRIRLELLPQLAAYYNVNVNDALLRMSELISADNTLLDKLAENAFRTCCVSQDENTLLLDCTVLNGLDIALRRRVVRQAISAVRGSLQNVGYAAIEMLLAHAEQQTAFGMTLPHTGPDEVRISLRGPQLRIEKSLPSASRLAWQIVLNAPGETPIACCGGVASLRRFINGREVLHGRTETFNAEQKNELERRAALLAFPEANLQFPLVLRSWQAGDRMRPLGLDGTKKLQDVFTDAKISAGQRANFPVLAEANGEGAILAVIGLRAGERVMHDYEKYDRPVWLFEWSIPS